MNWSDIVDELATYKKRDTATEPRIDGSCPVCDRYVRKDENFCPGCGQRLKWSEEK